MPHGYLVHRPAPFKLPGRAGVVSARKHWSLPRGVAALAAPRALCQIMPLLRGAGYSRPPSVAWLCLANGHHEIEDVARLL